MIQILFIVGLLFIPGLYHHYGTPFRLSKVSVDWPYDPAWEVGDESAEISSILSEPFTFLGKGVQSFAFASNDGKYVLKCFRFDACKMPQARKIALWVKTWIGKRQRKDNRPAEIFKACKLTFDQLQEETGLLWIHLNLKPGNKIKVYDAFGRSHWIDPAKNRFVLQKRAVRLMTALEKATENEQKEIFASFVQLLKALEEKGIATTDSKLRSNFGMMDGRAVQIDFADNVYDPLSAHKNTEHFVNRLKSKM